MAVLLVMTAGCVRDADDGNGTSMPTDGNGGQLMQDPVVRNGTGTIDRSVTTPVGGGIAQGSTESFMVNASATLVHAEFRWDDDQFDLNGALDDADTEDTGGQDTFEHTDDGGSFGSPNSPHNITVAPGDVEDDAWAGEWRLTAFANGAAIGLEYEWAVTVFYGETTVPDGYSALPGA